MGTELPPLTSWLLCETLQKNCTRIAETIGRVAQQNMITERPELTPEYLKSQGLSSSFPERFWAKVKKTDGCWLWQGVITRLGYGQIGRGIRIPKTISAHRAAWILNRGPIPDGLCCLHHCDCPRCVFVGHLFLGTQKDNKRDCMNKSRHARGETSGRAKLSEQEVIEIINFFKSGNCNGVRRLGRKYGVNHGTISRIKNGFNWRHITHPQD